MKRLEGLDEKLKTLEGKEFDDKLTKKELLMRVLFQSKANPKDALKISIKLLPMLQADKAVGEFEDAEFDLIKQIVETNELQINIGVFGQLMSIFDEKEKV